MLENEDIQEILRLLDATEFQQLQLDTDRFSLCLRRSAAGWTAEQEVVEKPVSGSQLVSGMKKPQAVSNNTEHAVNDAIGAYHRHGPEVSADLDQDDPVVNAQGIRTPLPGIFYRSPQPGAPAFVEVGDHVQADTQVCIIESMKLMNAVYAGVSGTVVEICLQDGDFAEKDSVVLRVRKTQAQKEPS